MLRFVDNRKLSAQNPEPFFVAAGRRDSLGGKMTARHVESVLSEMKGGKIRPAADRSTWGNVGSHDRVNHKRGLA
ncbi:MAG: hypothetical protein A2X96_10385 [Syntrophobacterales bacterium GWC2_56_13]|nr:MAG: hypothetical protein A2X96_10385 [Syntrophobacterales bacterium GWC2_56_13]